MANAYPFLNSITDPAAKKAAKNILDRLAQLESQVTGIGSVTKTLTQTMNAGANRLENVQDPRDPQDAVTKRFLQQYVANAFSALQGVQAQAGGGVPAPGAPPTKIDNIANHADIVVDIWNLAPLGPGSTVEEVFRFTQKVAWAIAGLGEDPLCGLLLKPSGDNIFTCAGETYSISRVCYSNGHIFKILADAEGARTPQWVDNGFVDVDLYHVATDPAGSC